ncbi:DUF4179 domain-containing protein [Desulfoscipio sp. XC116]|uniref:DUF4179 domain-containing protein n=1 Tax=Desulfoscipio sp. XC116 TaxID=3144975 RepID=UPI00325A7265
MRVRISELCSRLDGSFYENMEIENTTGLCPSQQRIAQIARAKLREQVEQESGPAGGPGEKDQEKRMGMKKNSRVILIAVVLCLFSATALAASGGWEFFKPIFGSSVQNVQDDVWSPLLADADQTYKMTVESMLSDGYKTNIVVSLENLTGQALNLQAIEVSRLFIPEAEDDAGSFDAYSCEELPEFAGKAKKYYYLTVSSLRDCTDAPLTISLAETVAPLKVKVKINGSLAAKEIKIDAKPEQEQNYCPETVQLSPLGVLVTGREKQATGGLPTVPVDLLMKDGSSEELLSEMSFDDGEETVTGGGGAVIVDEGQEPPLVIQTMGERNPDGKVVTTGYFSRILNLNEVRAIRVDGTEYRLD